MNLAQALADATARLKDTSDSPRLDAEMLAAHVLGKSRGSLYACDRDELAATAQARLQELVEARCQRVPVAYLTGDKGFWTLDLHVTPAVLVPRPETELLVEWALERLISGDEATGSSGPRILDLGTGSGAIALSLARERPGARIVATDASAAALAVARDNASRHALANVEFRSGDWWSAVEPEARFDLVVSNPPYIAADDVHLDALAQEPRMALTDEGDGLGCLRSIVAGAGAHLQPGGWLLLEHGYDQAASVRAMLSVAGFVEVQTRRDLAGHERATGGRWP